MASLSRNRFFLGIHGIFLFVVLLGFAPSFYLRPLGEATPLPLYLIVHGIACTSWFVCIFFQSYLVQTRQLTSHKKLGLYFGLLAPIITISGFVVTYYRIEKYFLGTSEFALANPERPEFESMLIWGDIFVLISFLLIVYLGYIHRKRPAFHARYMLFASVMIVPQAFIRLGKFSWLQIGDDPAGSGSLYALAGPLLVLISLLVYDRRRLKKIHRATQIAWAWYVFMLVFVALIMRTGLGEALLSAIKWI